MSYVREISFSAATSQSRRLCGTLGADPSAPIKVTDNGNGLIVSHLSETTTRKCVESEVADGGNSIQDHPSRTRVHTSFLHEAEEVIQKLFSLRVSVQFIQLWRGRGGGGGKDMMMRIVITANTFDVQQTPTHTGVSCSHINNLHV